MPKLSVRFYQSKNTPSLGLEYELTSQDNFTKNTWEMQQQKISGEPLNQFIFENNCDIMIIPNYTLDKLNVLGIIGYSSIGGAVR